MNATLDEVSSPTHVTAHVMTQASTQALPGPMPRAVLVHGGARDSYQLALALYEAGMLETLVTDLYFSPETNLARSLQKYLPAPVLALLKGRSTSGLPSSCVTLCRWSGGLATLLERLRRVPFPLRRAARRFSDARLGRVAGSLARRRHAGLVSYSYFGYHAFAAYGLPALLFQVHPHPATVRAILQNELQAHPECSQSLLQEWELALPAKDFRRLEQEAGAAKHYIVASSFTRQSLIDHGVPAGSIDVVPYGVDLQKFSPRSKSPDKSLTNLPGKPQGKSNTLQLLFVGRINQRKGISYLLEAMTLLAGRDVHLTVCGRVVDDLSLFQQHKDRITVRPSVSPQQLMQAYRDADLFVFPSVAEGFGQVLLEALACGLPILSTTHTAAPDLIEDGVQGWVVEPRRPDLLADRIAWACDHRDELTAMAARARRQAELFTPALFRTRAAAVVERFLRANTTLHAATLAATR